MVDEVSIASNFAEHFQIVIANESKVNEAFKIRHEVYARELGWEPIRDSGMETDEFDSGSMHLLLLHRRSEMYAGCIRLVCSDNQGEISLLPFETHCSEVIEESRLNLTELHQLSYGEISRLAVPEQFRRRQGEAKMPFVMNEFNPASLFTKSEMRAVPNIALGLYMGSLCLASLNHQQFVFALMESRLCRRLRRLGIMFESVSDAIEWRGSRMVYRLEVATIEQNLPTPIHDLYRILYESLAGHPSLIRQ